MKNKWFPIWLLTFALVCSIVQPLTAHAITNTNGQKEAICLSPKMVQLKGDMQKVWIDHTIWTRSYIVSAMSNRVDQKDVLDRLLRNQHSAASIETSVPKLTLP
ncbi:hypothetical protein [Paenibacillus sanfengchensis]|uniref:hypothetical protein n=1 Tax=Paenibacillus TaxID=44249 RepID=UPI003A5B9B31